MTAPCLLAQELETRRIVLQQGNPLLQLLPGSTIKPIVLQILLDTGKLKPGERFPCPIQLTLGGHRLTCSHPPTAAPFDATAAIGYSCNCFTAHFAARLKPAELVAALAHSGLAASRIETPADVEGVQLLALGTRHITVTPHDLLLAYGALARRAGRAILEGLEAAVEYGTAQRAALPRVRVAGKTGTASGNAAWFAGFAPSRSPRFAAVVLAAGKSGGADAAPLASRLFSELLTGRLK